jgi:hypothetical protein
LDSLDLHKETDHKKESSLSNRRRKALEEKFVKFEMDGAEIDGYENCIGKRVIKKS